MPDPAPELAKLKSYDDWLGIRKRLSPPIPENSIYLLPYMDAERSSKLTKEGITTADEIKDFTVLKKSTQKYLSAKAEGQRVVEKEKLNAFLSEISYPIYYFDYEASQSLIPHGMVLALTNRFRSILSSYLERANSELEHHEYLHRDASNPMPSLIASLKENVSDEGSILVWYESYEKSRNKEMAEMYPNSAEFLKAFNDRIIDLMKPFSQDIVRDEAFMGSSSIRRYFLLWCLN